MSKRGEHVINNNVLKLFKNIIDRFVKQRGLRIVLPEDPAHYTPEPGQIVLSEQRFPRTYRAYYTPLPRDITRAIGDTMVVTIDPTNNPNAEEYGKKMKDLSDGVVQYLNVLADKNYDGLNNIERYITDLVREINSGELYVDKEAEKHYLEKGGRAMLDRAKASVASMFELLVYKGGNDEVIQWLNELLGRRVGHP